MRDGVPPPVDKESEVLRSIFEFVHFHDLHEHQQPLSLRRSMTVVQAGQIEKSTRSDQRDDFVEVDRWHLTLEQTFANRLEVDVPMVARPRHDTRVVSKE